MYVARPRDKCMLMCSCVKWDRHFVALLNVVVCVCSENINDGFVTLLFKVRFFFCCCCFVFLFLLSISDSVSLWPCWMCAANSELTLYGDRCFTEWSSWIPGFRPNSRICGGSEDWRAAWSSQQVLLSDIDIAVAELDGRTVN